MGTIIHLNPPPKAAPPMATGEPPPHQCEIVIFPGVRIEREEPPSAAAASGPQSDGDTGSRPRKSS